jgi:hypothetical protein
MLTLGVAGVTTFQGLAKALKGSSSSFDGVCPSTPVSFGVACGMRISTVAAASCDDVLAEINARVNGQGSVWHDPHNNGTYTKCVNPTRTLPTLPSSQSQEGRPLACPPTDKTTAVATARAGGRVVAGTQTR